MQKPAYCTWLALDLTGSKWLAGNLCVKTPSPHPDMLHSVQEVVLLSFCIPAKSNRASGEAGGKNETSLLHVLLPGSAFWEMLHWTFQHSISPSPNLLLPFFFTVPHGGNWGGYGAKKSWSPWTDDVWRLLPLNGFQNYSPSRVIMHLIIKSVNKFRGILSKNLLHLGG